MKKMLLLSLSLLSVNNLFATQNLIETKTLDSSDITNLVFDLSSENVELYESTENDIVIEIYCNNKQYIPEIRQTSSSLEIIRQKKYNFSFFKYTNCLVKVFLPVSKTFDEILIEAVSGKIQIHKTLTANAITINSVSGEIESENGLFADKIKINSVSGRITSNNMDADDLTAKSNSGKIKITKYTGGTGTVCSTSGEIEIDSFAVEYGRFQSNSGRITVKDFDCDYFDTKSTSGSQYIVLKHAPIAKSNLESNSGSIDLIIPKSNSFEIEVHSNSGSFKDGFSNNKFVPRTAFHEKINNGGAVINISTTSGGITLDY